MDRRSHIKALAGLSACASVGIPVAAIPTTPAPPVVKYVWEHGVARMGKYFVDGVQTDNPPAWLKRLENASKRETLQGAVLLEVGAWHKDEYKP